MSKPVHRSTSWRRIVDRLSTLAQYITGQETSAEDNNDAVFLAVFPEIDAEGNEKRALSRYRVCIPALLTYGIAGNSEKTEVTNLNSRGLVLYCSDELSHGSSIEVELILPSELNLYGRRRVRYHAAVVRVEPQPSGQRFGIAAAIKNCEDLPLEKPGTLTAEHQ